MARGRSRGKGELFALGVVLLVLVAFPAGIFGYQAWRVASAGVKAVDIVARVPEQGGFNPDRFTLRVGETVRLRISSPDVVHGLTIPGLGVNVDEIYAGKVVEVDVTPDKPAIGDAADQADDHNAGGEDYDHFLADIETKT